MTTKERIIQFCKYKGIPVKQFEQKCGMSNGYVSSMRRSLGLDKLSNVLSAFPEIDRDWLLYGEGEMIKTSADTQVNQDPFALKTDAGKTTRSVPLYEITATAGLVAIFQDQAPAPVDYLSIPDLPQVDGAIYVRGDSMAPLIKSGDIVIYKRVEMSLNTILWGHIYLLSYTIDGDTYTLVKYLRPSDREGYLRLISANDFYDPVEIPAEAVTAIALVKASLTFHTIG